MFRIFGVDSKIFILRVLINKKSIPNLQNPVPIAFDSYVHRMLVWPNIYRVSEGEIDVYPRAVSDSDLPRGC